MYQRSLSNHASHIPYFNVTDTHLRISHLPNDHASCNTGRNEPGTTSGQPSKLNRLSQAVIVPNPNAGTPPASACISPDTAHSEAGAPTRKRTHTSAPTVLQSSPFQSTLPEYHMYCPLPLPPVVHPKSKSGLQMPSIPLASINAIPSHLGLGLAGEARCRCVLRRLTTLYVYTLESKISTSPKVETPIPSTPPISRTRIPGHSAAHSSPVMVLKIFLSEGTHIVDVGLKLPSPFEPEYPAHFVSRRTGYRNGWGPEVYYSMNGRMGMGTELGQASNLTARLNKLSSEHFSSYLRAHLVLPSLEGDVLQILRTDERQEITKPTFDAYLVHCLSGAKLWNLLEEKIHKSSPDSKKAQEEEQKGGQVGNRTQDLSQTTGEDTVLVYPWHKRGSKVELLPEDDHDRTNSEHEECLKFQLLCVELAKYPSGKGAGKSELMCPESTRALHNPLIHGNSKKGMKKGTKKGWKKGTVNDSNTWNEASFALNN
ncbi:hypothetical protein DFH06DRAFT_1135442 [Mycena polygramma]|nr:hypothetical protein DFH06DRAFT_1135442 [Mycena polygramma]